jgi:hypothetical protein
MNPKQSVALFGVRFVHVHFRRQSHRPLEWTVIDLHCQHLNRAPLGIRRLGSLSITSDHDAMALNHYINLALIYAGDIDANAHAFLATKSINRRLPGGWGKLEIRELIAHVRRPAVQPTESDTANGIHFLSSS